MTGSTVSKSMVRTVPRLLGSVHFPLVPASAVFPRGPTPSVCAAGETPKVPLVSWLKGTQQGSHLTGRKEGQEWQEEGRLVQLNAGSGKRE